MQFNRELFEKASERFVSEGNLDPYFEIGSELKRLHPLVEIDYQGGESLDIRAEYTSGMGVKMLFVVELTKSKARLQLRQRVFHDDRMISDAGGLIYSSAHERRVDDLCVCFNQFRVFLRGAHSRG